MLHVSLSNRKVWKYFCRQRPCRTSIITSGGNEDDLRKLDRRPCQIFISPNLKTKFLALVLGMQSNSSDYQKSSKEVYFNL